MMAAFLICMQAPSISNIANSVTNKDDKSTCESLDEDSIVTQWIKTLPTTNLNEQYDDDGYPSNEEILEYICGAHNLRSNEILELKKLPKTEEGSLNFANIKQAVINQHDTRSLDGESFNQRRGVADKDSNLQANTAEDYPPSTIPLPNKRCVTLNTNSNSVPDKLYIMDDTTHHWHSPQKGKDNNNSNSLYHCGNIAIHNNSLQVEDFSQCKKTAAYKTENVNSDQLDSSEKLTETTNMSSASSHDVNISIEEGEYIESKSPMHNVKDDVICIPLQPHNSHQITLTHFDKTFSTTTAMEGEYIDYNTAVQQN